MTVVLPDTKGKSYLFNIMDTPGGPPDLYRPSLVQVLLVLLPRAVQSVLVLVFLLKDSCCFDTEAVSWPLISFTSLLPHGILKFRLGTLRVYQFEFMSGPRPSNDEIKASQI